MSELTKIKVVISKKIEIAKNIYLFEFQKEDQSELPGFLPGSHIMVETPSGKNRQYSLCYLSPDKLKYSISVKYEGQGRGGSISLVDDTEVGDTLYIYEPKDDFEFNGFNSGKYIFIAGGIGITPIYSMIQFLESKGNNNWELHYLTKNKEVSAFINELESRKVGGKVKIYFTEDLSGDRINLDYILSDGNDRYLYCCGPESLMNDVREKTSHWSEDSVKFERFGANNNPSDQGETSFKVHVMDFEQEVVVSSDRTILQCLLDAGINIPYACESGTCGTCVCELLEGHADHRDLVLSESERSQYIVPCVSRSASNDLTIRLLS